ncbi:MAG: Trm112 family protein [Acidimicrobiia bacterium]
MALPEELMSILVCPDCHGDLEERPASGEESGRGDTVLVCLQCGLHYPVRDGIPVMLIEEAFRPEPGSGSR